jgi:hypothetical protein
LEPTVYSDHHQPAGAMMGRQFAESLQTAASLPLVARSLPQRKKYNAATHFPYIFQVLFVWALIEKPKQQSRFVSSLFISYIGKGGIREVGGFYKEILFLPGAASCLMQDLIGLCLRCQIRHDSAVNYRNILTFSNSSRWNLRTWIACTI